MRRLSLYIRPRLLDNTGSSLYIYGLRRKKMNLIKQKKKTSVRIASLMWKAEHKALGNV
jgi:hypothetical protein